MNTAVFNQTFPGLDVDFLGPKQSGKVRDIYARDDRLILITTDRLSAFDHILGLVPFKGQVLNQLSSFWFEQTRDIIANHFLESPDPNVTIARKCRPLPVEVVVRGFISGVTKTSLWYQYSQGERNIYGMDFPDGMSKNDRLPQPVITPTTKAEKGGHDELITSEEILEKGLVADELWEQACTAALALFARGQDVASRGGLLLVDTKYEFGLADDGRLILIDEIHTPDSSRFWTATSYEEVRPGSGRNGDHGHNAMEPENFDKEFVRLAYAQRGYIGDGPPPPLEQELAVQASRRYVECYERLTARPFEAGGFPVAGRVAESLRALFAKN